MNKRNYPTVDCADCGREAKAVNKQTKFCATCRLARGCTWQDGRESVCACGAKYIAWNGPRSNPRCGRCAMQVMPSGGREAVEGTCVECKEPGVVFSDKVSICYPCLHDPKNKDWVKASVLRRHRRLIDARNTNH